MRSLGALLSAVLLFGVPLSGQGPDGPDLKSVLSKLQSAIRHSDLVTAADLASTLDDGVQRKFLTFLNGDATQRVADVLARLPSDVESLFVLQEPITVKSTDSSASFAGKPEELYAVGRLLALNGGQLYRGLQGKTIRLTVAGMRDIGARKQRGVPSVMPEADVTYFYTFTEPLDTDSLGVPDEQIGTHPLWRGTAAIETGERSPGTREHAQREDESWVALATPELLVVGSRRKTITDLLTNSAERDLKAANRALPDSLPEWSKLDRRAAFWGLRHYSDLRSRGDISNPRSDTPERPAPDHQAIGITVTSDPENGDVEAWYFTAADRFALARDVNLEFQITPVSKGTWQLKSNIREKGDFPFHYAAYLLGFGSYQ